MLFKAPRAGLDRRYTNFNNNNNNNNIIIIIIIIKQKEI